MMNIYENPILPTKASIEDALCHDNSDTLHRIVVAVSLMDTEFDFAHALCLRLANHRDETVRGNAILGFGHLARRFKSVGPQSIEAIQKGLDDSSHYVRQQAWTAATDVVFFTKAKIEGFDENESITPK